MDLSEIKALRSKGLSCEEIAEIVCRSVEKVEKLVLSLEREDGALTEEEVQSRNEAGW